MTASGTAGYGIELAGYMDLASLGAVVVKSLAAFEWARQPGAAAAPDGRRGCSTPSGCRAPACRTGSTTCCPTCCAPGRPSWQSIWGRSVDDYARAAELLAAAPPEVVAVEVNLSCPNLEGRHAIFAHDAELSAAVIAATAVAGRPRWAKLSANTDRIVEVAGAAATAGADAVTCINTLLGLAYDPTTRRPVLGAGGGGLSGPAIHPVAVRAVHDVHAAHPGLPIVGVGGVASGVGRRPSCCSPARPRCRSARRRSPTRGRAAKVLAGLR